MTQFKFGGKLKITALALLVIGALFFGIGWATYGSDSGHGQAHGDTTEHVSTSHQEDGHAKELTAEEIKHHENQKNNRPWSALYLAVFFTTVIALGAAFFMAIQHAAQAGWSIVVLRIMEAMIQYLPIGGAIIILIFILGANHTHHIFHWMDPELTNPNSPAFDPIIDHKKGWLNSTSFIIRAVLYVAGWTFFAFKIRSLSRAQDKDDTIVAKHQLRLRNWSAGFIVFFAVTSSTMAWDWIMSIDPHWFSTLFGWYNMMSYLVSAVSLIALIAIYLKSRGYLPMFNDNHMHDLGKYMFGFSIFWTYLWFSQFMLIWYSDIPEEVTYYVQRFEQYPVPFLGMILINFIVPVLTLVNSEFKRIPFIIIFAAIVIICGHYLDFYLMIMPGSVGGDYSGFGFLELGAFMFFIGLFMFVTFSALTKASLEPKGNAFWHESEIFVY